MPLEIERRFRVKTNAWAMGWQFQEHTPIVQGYLAVTPENTVVRVRRAGERGFLTIKRPTYTVGAALEYEYEIPKADALELLATCTHTITKVRTKVPAGNGLYWEVDQFAGANDGLVLAEIELPSIDTPIEIPDWLGDEITGDHSYANSRLALVPKVDHHLLYPWEDVLLKAST